MALTSGELLCSPAGVIGLIGFELVILLVTLTGAGTGLRSFNIVATGTWKEEISKGMIVYKLFDCISHKLQSFRLLF